MLTFRAAAAAAAAIAILFVPAGRGARHRSCGFSGYSYAGVLGVRPVHGVATRLHALAYHRLVAATR